MGACVEQAASKTYDDSDDKGEAVGLALMPVSVNPCSNGFLSPRAKSLRLVQTVETDLW